MKDNKQPICSGRQTAGYLLAIILCLAGAERSEAQTIITKANTATMNNASDWSPSTVPTNTNIGKFDSTISSGNEGSLTLGASVTLAGLQFANNLNGAVSITGGNTLTLNTSLYFGAAGIDMSVANQSVTIGSALTLNGKQAWNVVSGQTLTVGGTFTHTGAGVDFSAFAGTLSGLANDASGILGPWATTGSGTALRYATVSGGVVSGYTGGTVATAGGMNSATTDYTLAGALTLSASSFANTLQYTGANATLGLPSGDTLTLSGMMSSGASILTVGANTAVNTPPTAVITNGASQELVISANASATNIMLASMMDNPAGPSSVTFNGPGTLILGTSGANVYDNSSLFSGNFVINGGVVSVLKSVNISTVAVANSSPVGNRSVAGRSVIVNSGAILSFDGTSGNELGRGLGAGGGGTLFPLFTTVVNKGGTLRATTSNRTIGPLVLNGGTVGITAPNAAYAPLGLSSSVTVIGSSPSFITNSSAGGGINLTAVANTSTTFYVNDVTGDSNVDLTVSAVLDGGVNNVANASLIKAGTGTMLLSNTNTYTGTTTISAGTIIAGTNSPSGVAGALGNASSAIILGDVNTTANNSTAALLTGGAFTIGRPVTVSANPTPGVYTIGGNTDTNSTFSGAITISTNFTISQVANTGANTLTISGGIAGAGGVASVVTFSGPGNVNVATAGITDGGGTLAVNITGGTNTFSAVNAYSGGTTVANASFVVNGSITGNVIGNSGSIIGGGGTIAGNVTVSGNTLPGAAGATNTIGGSLTYNSGSEANFNLSSSALLGDNQIALSGSGTVLTIGTSINVGINCGSILDTAHDYVLFNLTGGGSLSGSFNATPIWLATAPTGAANYSIVSTNSGTQVVLHYAGATGPSINASSATPNPVLRNQPVAISVSVTAGSAPIASVTVNAGPIGGSATQALISDGVGDYTNTVTISAGTAPGAKTLNVTVTDSNSNIAAVGIPLTVNASLEVWNGAAGDNNWSSANWTSGFSPGLAGDSLDFGGTTRLSPVMNNSYNVNSFTFDGTAGSFNITSSGNNSLTLAGGLTNNSTSAETLNVPVTLSLPVTVNASSGTVTLGQNITNGGNLLTVSDGGFNTVIAGGIFGNGGLTMNGTGTNIINGNSSFSGPTTVNSGTVALLGTNSPSTTAVANSAILQLANSNAVTGTLTLHSGSILQLRGDNSTTFTNAGISVDNASDTNNFDVNSVTSATGQTLTLAGALAYINNSAQLINVTGNSGYTLGLGDITATTTVQGTLFDINAVPGSAGVIINSFTSGNYGNYLNMTGGGNVTVRGKLANTSNGSVDLFVNTGTTLTLQGPSVVTSVVAENADAYCYFVENGTLVVDNSSALTNNTTLTGIKLSQFVLGGALVGNYSGTGYANGGDTSGVAVTNNNSYNCAVYLGDANFQNGGITMSPTVTNIVSDGGFLVSTFTTFENSGTYTIGGQNTSGTNTFANPIILGYTPNTGKSVTVVATAGGEVDFTGGILQNGGDTTAAVTVGDSIHTGLVKFAGVNDTYPGGTTAAYGNLLVNNTIGTGSSTVTVNSGAELGGNGIILDPLTIQAGGILSPGLGNGDTSALTANNTVTLGGSVTFTLNRANTPNSSQVTGITTLTAGGTLTLTNAGATLQSGDTFTLFSAGGYTGSFSATNLPALSAGLSWSNNVAGNGTISVIGAAAPAMPPSIGNVSLTAGNIAFSGTNGPAGQQYRILMATNLLQSAASWVPVATNNFAPNGGYTNSLPVNPAQGNGFFRLVTP